MGMCVSVCACLCMLVCTFARVERSMQGMERGEAGEVELVLVSDQNQP